MSRKAKVPKGILGVPKRAERQVFVFGRFAEELPSDDSDDGDFNPDDEIATTSKETKQGSKKQNDSKKRKFDKKTKPGPACTNNKGVTGTLQKKTSKKQKAETGPCTKNKDVSGTLQKKTGKKRKAETAPCTNNKDVNETSQELHLTGKAATWELFPTELLLMIFKNVIKSTSGSTVPFLCRMSRVCRRWREVASEPVLWKKVDLSTTSFQYLRSCSATIQRLAPIRLTAVTELSLSGWDKLTDKAIEAIGRHCHELQSIVLSHCENLTPGGIASLADKCHQLKMIDIAFTKINISGLQHITKVLGSQLEKISLRNCTNLGGELILPLIQDNCPNLTSLDLSGTNIRTFNVEKLQAGCPKLKELYLVNLAYISATPTLKTLNNEMKPNGFPQLENLGFPCGRLQFDFRTDKLLHRILWTSHNLKVLDLRGPNRISAEGLRKLPATSLEQLYLSNTSEQLCRSNSAAFSTVAAIVEKWHHSLEVLDLSLNTYIGDEHMELLGNFTMPTLHTLDINGTGVTAGGVRSISNGCPNLTDLNLSGCRGLPRGIKHRLQGESVRNISQRLVDIEQ